MWCCVQTVMSLCQGLSSLTTWRMIPSPSSNNPDPILEWGGISIMTLNVSWAFWDDKSASRLALFSLILESLIKVRWPSTMIPELQSFKRIFSRETFRRWTPEKNQIRFSNFSRFLDVFQLLTIHSILPSKRKCFRGGRFLERRRIEVPNSKSL